MVQKLQKVVARVKVGNTSENLLNEIRLIMCFLYQAKETINNMMNLRGKTPDPYRLYYSIFRIKWTYERMLFYWILAYYIYGKVWKSHTKTIGFKCKLQHGRKTLDYQMYHFLYQIFKVVMRISRKKHPIMSDKWDKNLITKK